jgi:FlaA1/EpsC-like NDP-sugar epimerase
VLRLYDTPALRVDVCRLVDVLSFSFPVFGAVALKTDDWWLQTFRPSAFLMIAILAPITVLVFTQFGIYRGAWRFADASDFVRAGSAVAVAAGIGSVAANLVPHDIVLPDRCFSSTGW